MSTEQIGRDIAKEIALDISGRKGIGNEWEEIDPEIRDEILTKWASFAVIAIERGDQ